MIYKDEAAQKFNNALLLIRKNELSKAVDELSKSIKLYSEDIETLNLLGLCQYWQCNFDKAYFYWNKSLEISLTDNEAQRYLKTLKSAEFEKMVLIYNNGIELINQGEYSGAISSFEQIINNDSDLIEPYILTGLSYIGLNKFGKAREFFGVALKKDKNNINSLRYLNSIQTGSNANLKKTLLPMSVLFIFIICLYFVNANKYNELIKENDNYKNIVLMYDKTINELNEKISGNESAAENEGQDGIIENEGEVFNRALQYFKNKDYILSSKEFEKVVSSGIEEYRVAEALYFSAVSYQNSGNYGKAEENYREYINKYRSKNYYDDALYNCGIMMYKLGKKEDAKELLTKLKDELPDSIFVNSKVTYILNN